MNALILNAGSSSLRVQWIEERGLTTKFKGHVDGIGLKTCQLRGDVERNVKVKNHEEALEVILAALKEKNPSLKLSDIKWVGHRVVHGGEKYHEPTKVTKTVMRELKKLCTLAPLHNPANLAGIEACQKWLPKAKNIAVFDTGFHHTLPESAYLYGIPFKLYKKYGIRKYGFHGISHEYVSQESIKYLKENKRPHENLIICHIGNGISVTAIKNGESIDTSMGFTPLAGPMMGTRCGSIDPTIPLFLQTQLKRSPDQINHLLNKESGLLGISELTSDMRPLWEIRQNKKHPHHKKVMRAFEMLSSQLAKIIGGQITTLGGLDALIFTAGIGESAWYLREDICKKLEFLDLKISPWRNQKRIEGDEGPLHIPSSKVAVLVIHTNEEKQMAKEVFSL